MNLTGSIIDIDNLSEEHVNQMFHLMRDYYDNVSREVFLHDLLEKDSVILLKSANKIMGFSTQMLLEHTIDGKNVIVIFSGDTIIDKSCWGTLALPVAFGQMMLNIKTEYQDKELYWFLISKGYRTYRFLPTFFKTYYPNSQGWTGEFEKRLLREVATAKFGSDYDDKAGIIRAKPDSQKVKAGICDISDQRRNNKHVAFFERCNPGHANGDELACIARLDKSNINPIIIKRIMEKLTEGICR